LVIGPKSGHPRIRLAEFLPFALIRGAGIPARPVPAPTTPRGTDSETPGCRDIHLIDPRQ